MPDTKLFLEVKSQADGEELQKHLTDLNEWAIKWEMNFNIDKCKVMHMGENNISSPDTMLGSELAVQEEDLGVIVDESLKMPTQHAVVTKNAVKCWFCKMYFPMILYL